MPRTRAPGFCGRRNDHDAAIAEAPLHPPAVGAHGLAARLFQTQARQEPCDLAAQELLGHALEAPEVPETLRPTVPSRALEGERLKRKSS